VPHYATFYGKILPAEPEIVPFLHPNLFHIANMRLHIDNIKANSLNIKLHITDMTYKIRQIRGL